MYLLPYAVYVRLRLTLPLERFFETTGSLAGPFRLCLLSCHKKRHMLVLAAPGQLKTEGGEYVFIYIDIDVFDVLYLLLLLVRQFGIQYLSQSFNLNNTELCNCQNRTSFSSCFYKIQQRY